MLSTQGGVEGHHQGKAGHQPQGGVGLVTIAVRFRDHLVGDHKQHGACGQPQPYRVGDGHAAGEADPSRAPRGSSKPLAMATNTATQGLNPAAHMASATASPSGMSCRAMAVVNGSPTDISPERS